MMNTKSSTNVIPIILMIILASCSLSRHVEVIKTTSEALSYEDYVEEWLEERVDYVQRNKRIPATPSQYKITGDCGGYPRVDVKTAPGFCLGLLYNGEGLSMPRWALAINDSTIVISDMVNWNPNNGSIHLLKKNLGKWKLHTIFTKESFKNNPSLMPVTDRPNQIALGPKGKIFVGGASGIMSFDPLAKKPANTLKLEVGLLPNAGIHALKSFTFDRDENIYINIGAETNVCQKYGLQGENRKACPEAEAKPELARAVIRRYLTDGKGGFKKDYIIYARGLRNSVALTYDPVLALILEAENGRDAIDRFDKSLNGSELPHDELNVLKKARNYGWPYCYDKGRNNPEWPDVDCKDFVNPDLLLPAHSAPLSLHVYKGEMFPHDIYHNSIFVSLHGYEKHGHRLALLKRDPKTLYPSGKPLSVVYGWDSDGTQLMGSPVGITNMSDGSLLITEDKSKTIMRLFFDAKKGNGHPVDEGVIADAPQTDADLLEEKRLRLEEKLRDPNVSAFTKFQAKVIDKQCIMCHGGSAFPGVQLLQYDDDANLKHLVDSGKVDLFYQRVFGVGGKQMPPQGFLTENEKTEAIELLNDWYQEMNRPLPLLE
jgi:glucose/arabinose dehydrogenase/cytochrome c5